MVKNQCSQIVIFARAQHFAVISTWQSISATENIGDWEKQ
jgi:hypothetical protein